jgi:sulfofructose kinase
VFLNSGEEKPVSRDRVIVVGCAFWDTIFRVERIPQKGEKILPQRAVQTASGMATAAAVTIARLGGAVSLWTRIGDDRTGRAFVDEVAGEGLSTEGIRRVPGARTWFSTILVDQHGERLVVPFIDPALDGNPAWLPLDEIAEAGAVLCDMRWVEGARAAFSQARRLGVPTILDADTAPVQDLLSLSRMADHVLFSEPALRSLGTFETPEEALLTIAAELDATVVGVTLGERGSAVWRRDGSGGTVHRFASPKIAAIDTLNAGDVWHGTYAYGLVHGWAFERTIRAASVAAAIKCERFGGRAGSPTLPELLRRLQEWERITPDDGQAGA